MESDYTQLFSDLSDNAETLARGWRPYNNANYESFDAIEDIADNEDLASCKRLELDSIRSIGIPPNPIYTTFYQKALTDLLSTLETILH